MTFKNPSITVEKWLTPLKNWFQSWADANAEGLILISQFKIYWYHSGLHWYMRNKDGDCWKKAQKCINCRYFVETSHPYIWNVNRLLLHVEVSLHIYCTITLCYHCIRQFFITVHKTLSTYSSFELKVQLVKQAASTWAKCAAHVLNTSFAFKLPLTEISVKKTNYK